MSTAVAMTTEAVFNTDESIDRQLTPNNLSPADNSDVANNALLYVGIALGVLILVVLTCIGATCATKIQQKKTKQSSDKE